MNSIGCTKSTCCKTSFHGVELFAFGVSSVIRPGAANRKASFLKIQTFAVCKDQCEQCSIGINLASKSGPTASYLYNTPARLSKKGSVAQRQSIPCPQSPARRHSPYAAKLPSSFQRHSPLFEMTSTRFVPLAVHDPKHIALSFITSSFFQFMLQPLHIIVIFLFAMTNVIGAVPVFPCFIVAQRVVRHLRPLLHYCHLLLIPAAHYGPW